jgi:hypothetical protein
MSATIARQGGRVQLEQSDMRQALNKAKMAKEGFLRATTEETKYLIKKPHTEVRKEKKRGIEFPGHNKVKAAIQRHTEMLHHNLTSGCLSCHNGTAKNPQTRWRGKGTSAPPPVQHRVRTPEPTPHLPGTSPAPPAPTGNTSELNLLMSTICWPDIRIRIQLFPVRNDSKMMRIPSTIPISIQIC